MRRSQVWYLYLTGLNKAEIADKLKISESTVDRDLENVSAYMENKEVDFDKVTNEALNSLRALKAMLLGTFAEAEGKEWTRARILSIMKDIDVKILERATQPPRIGKQTNIAMIKEDVKMIVDFLADKHPEMMGEFREFLKGQKTKLSLPGA